MTVGPLQYFITDLVFKEPPKAITSMVEDSQRINLPNELHEAQANSVSEKNKWYS